MPLLDSHMPFYQSAVRNMFGYELISNDYARVIQAIGNSNASFTIENSSLEFDVVTKPNRAEMIRHQYTNRIAIYYDRVPRHCKIHRDKSDSIWNINLNVPARSIKGIVMLFEDTHAAFQRDTSASIYPKIT